MKIKLKFKYIFFFLISSFFFFESNLHSLEPNEIKTDKGIKFWFVEDNSIPIISVNFSFSGGAFFDEDGKEGTSSFIASLLDEGAGNLSSIQFQNTMDEIGMKLSFASSRDSFQGSFQIISENKEQGFKLLKSVLTNPLLDDKDIEKIRNQILSGLKLKEIDVNNLASKEFHQVFFSSHSFGRNVEGTVSSINNISKNDLRNYIKKFLSISNLVIGVSGNVKSNEINNLIDDAFGHFVLKNQNLPVIPTKNNFPSGIQIEKKSFSQAAVLFGHKGLKRNDKNFFAARIVNYVLGGGGFQSRMYKNVREKRGLVYSIYSYLVPYKNNDILLGGFQTKNETVYEAISLVKDEWEKISSVGITQKEFEEAKTYYKGSFSRNLTSTSSISSLLKVVQEYGLPKSYFKNRNKIIDSLTLKEVNIVAKNLFKKEDLFFTIVGNVN